MNMKNKKTDNFLFGTHDHIVTDVDVNAIFMHKPDLRLSKEEMEVISRYGGIGGKKGLSLDEKMNGGALNEFFTPPIVCDVVASLARCFVARTMEKPTCKVLEPSCGSGNMIAAVLRSKSKGERFTIDAYEYNELNCKIARALYELGDYSGCKQPHDAVAIRPGEFEQCLVERSANDRRISPIFLARDLKKQIKNKEYGEYDLVIGNPPYGKRMGSRYKIDNTFMQNEFFFIYYGLLNLRKNGILAYVVPVNVLGSPFDGVYEKSKLKIAEIADLEFAMRLPSVFDKTNIPTDIIIMKRL